MRRHLHGARGTVDAHGAHGGKRFEHVEGGADLGADEHAAGLFDGHLHDQWHATADLVHRAFGGHDARLDHQQVLKGLQHQPVHPTLEQTAEGAPVRRLEFGPRRLAQAHELGAGADGAHHEPGALGGRVALGCPPGDARSLKRQGILQPRDLVLGEHDPGGPERVGFDHVGTRLEVPRVDRLDHIGAGEVEQFVAAVLRPPCKARARVPHIGGVAGRRSQHEVRLRQVGGLKLGAHRTVPDQHPLTQRRQKLRFALHNSIMGPQPRFFRALVPLPTARMRD